MDDKEKLWHREAVAPQAERTLSDFKQRSILTGFYLAGGTGLALHFGHSRSVDLDFFGKEAFDEDALLKKVEEMAEVALVQKDRQTLRASIQGTMEKLRVSFSAVSMARQFPQFGDLPGWNFLGHVGT